MNTLTLITALACGQLLFPHVGMGGLTGTPQTASGIASWDRFGSATWAGAPTPVGCVASAQVGGHSMFTCTGAFPTDNGTPSLVGSPYWPNGYSGAQSNAVSLNGSTDWVDLGQASHASTGLLVYGKINPSSVTGPIGILTHDDAGSNRSWSVTVYQGSLNFNIFSAPTTYSSIGCPVVAGRETIWAAFYQYVSDGSSILRMQCNGTSATPVTTATGPLATGTAATVIGAYGNSTCLFQGRISDLHFTDNASGVTTDQLAQMVAGQMDLLTAKPSQGPETYTGSGGLCCPVSDAWGWWAPVNVPCIKSTGISLEPAASNLLASDSMASGWTNTSTVTANAAIAPDGTLTAASLSGNGVAGNYIYVDGANTCSIWAEPSTGASGFIWQDNGGAHQCQINTTTGAVNPYGAGTSCTATGTVGGWMRYSMTVSTGISALIDALWIGGVGTINTWKAQCTPYLVPTRAQSTAGTPFSGPADALSTPVVLTNPAKFAIGFKATANWTDSPIFLSTGNTANAIQLYVVGPYAYFMINNASNQSSYVRSDNNSYNLWNTGTHTLIGYFDGSVGHIYADGVLADGAWVPTGIPGLSAMPPVLNISDATHAINGQVAKVCQATTYQACLSQLQ